MVLGRVEEILDAGYRARNVGLPVAHELHLDARVVDGDRARAHVGGDCEEVGLVEGVFGPEAVGVVFRAGSEGKNVRRDFEGGDAGCGYAGVLWIWGYGGFGHVVVLEMWV